MFITKMRGLYFTMKLLGLWPQTNWSNWYNSIWYIQSMGFAFVLFGPMAGLIRQRHDTKILIDNLGFVFILVGVCIKWAALATRRITFNKLLYSMEEDWINLEKKTLIGRNMKESERIMGKYSRLANIFFYHKVILNALNIINLLLDSFRARNSHSDSTNLDQLLLLPNSWYPVDYNRSFNIQFIVATQTITSTMMTLASSAIDSIFIASTLHLCGQFKILRHFIEGIMYDSSRPQNCRTEVRLIAKRHQELLGVVNNLQESYSLIIATQLVISTFTVCFLGYGLTLEIESIDTDTTVLVKIGGMCGAAVQIIFWYCLVGDLLTNESISITIAIYNAEWYNSTCSISLSLLLVMTRAGRPVEITGARLLPMSLKSFMSLMKTAATYLSVLRTIGVGKG